MLSLDEVIKYAQTNDQSQVWNSQIACLLIHKEQLSYQKTLDGASFYSFVFVKKGSFIIKYNGLEMELKPNDIHTYAPGMPTETIYVSDDYEGYFLAIDEKLAQNTPLMLHLVKAVYQPIAEFSKPLFSLSDEETERMWNLLTLLREHIIHPIDFQRESVMALCEVFCIDLINIQNVMIEHHKVNNRYEKLFSRFLPLVSEHFIKHHDLKFYSDALNISVPYLSRIVRMMSGRTVMSFIEYALANEIAKRLKTTDQSITDMAYDFAFSDQASFSKFFSRLKGMSPREFRKAI
jgi:AraC family transcriptional activator of pobA